MDEVVLAAIADLIGVPGLSAQARVIAGMATRLTGAGLPLGRDRAAAAAIAFSTNYMLGLPEDQRHDTERSPYMAAIEALRVELIRRTPAVAEVLESPVPGRLQARITHVVDDKKAEELLAALPEGTAATRTAMPAGGTHLDAIGTSKGELLSKKVWTGLTRKHFNIPLLTSSISTMESGLGCEKCLVCGDRLDPLGNHALFCDGGTWATVHTYLKHNVKEFLVAVAAGSGVSVSNIVLEAKGQLATNKRPGDVAGNVNGRAFAVDVFITRVSSATNRGKSVDKVIDDADAVKRAHYEQECKDSDVLFFTFGMDAEGRLGSQAEDTIRHFTNHLQGDQVTRDIFRRYWTRRIVVGFLARQMQLVLNRQERRSPRYSRIADLVARRDCGASAMPGGRLGGSNRGTRRHVSVVGLMQQTSVHAVS